jgi:hypothetical protein
VVDEDTSPRGRKARHGIVFIYIIHVVCFIYLYMHVRGYFLNAHRRILKTPPRIYFTHTKHRRLSCGTPRSKSRGRHQPQRTPGQCLHRHANGCLASFVSFRSHVQRFDLTKKKAFRASMLACVSYQTMVIVTHQHNPDPSIDRPMHTQRTAAKRQQSNQSKRRKTTLRLRLRRYGPLCSSLPQPQGWGRPRLAWMAWMVGMGMGRGKR